MKGMILAAGFGKRLRPLTEKQAKPSLPVVNVPLILYALHLLKTVGIREVIINLHHCPESIKKLVGGGRKLRMKISYSYEPKILGTGGGLKKAESFFQGEPLIVINGDIICNIDLHNAITFHSERDALATMIVREDKLVEKYGIIGLDPELKIQKFTDLITPSIPEKNLKKYMFTGIHIFSPEIFEYIPPAIETCINRYTYPRMIQNGEGVFGFVTKDFWSDLGTIESYFNTNLEIIKDPGILSFFDPLAQFQYAPKKEVDRVIRMGKNVNLREGAKLIDPVVIGDDCEIKKGSIIGPNVILGNKSVIEKNNHIKDSILWKGTKTSEGMTIQREIWAGKIKIPLEEDFKPAKLASSSSG